MAGGAKKPINIFRLKNTGEPPEVFNWKLWFAVISFGLMGAARGIDEGLISGAFNSKDFQRYINYETYSTTEQTNIKANVTAMVQIGSVGGALLYVLQTLLLSFNVFLLLMFTPLSTAPSWSVIALVVSGPLVNSAYFGLSVWLSSWVTVALSALSMLVVSSLDLVLVKLSLSHLCTLRKLYVQRFPIPRPFSLQEI